MHLTPDIATSEVAKSSKQVLGDLLELSCDPGHAETGYDRIGVDETRLTRGEAANDASQGTGTTCRQLSSWRYRSDGATTAKR